MAVEPRALVGLEVTRVSLDYQVTLLLGKAELVIETPFALGKDGVGVDVDPDTQHNYGAVVALLHRTITAASADDDGTLRVELDGGLSIVVPVDPRYESWEIVGRHGA